MLISLVRKQLLEYYIQLCLYYIRIPLGVPTALITKAVFLLHIIYRKGGTVFMLFRLILFRFNKFRYPLDPPEHRKMNSRVRQHKYRTLRFT